MRFNVTDALTGNEMQRVLYEVLWRDKSPQEAISISASTWFGIRNDKRRYEPD